VSVLYGGYEEWVARGYPTQPAGPEWQVGLPPAAEPPPAVPEPAAALNPLDDVRDPGL